MNIYNSKQLLRLSLGALIAIVILFCCKGTPTTPSPQKQPPTYSISGMVYYSTIPVDGLELHLGTTVWPGYPRPDIVTTTKAGSYRFENVIVGYGWYIHLEGSGWYAKIYALRSEFMPLAQNTDLTKDLYVYKWLSIISPGYWEVLNTSHQKISWYAIPEAQRYEIDLIHSVGEHIETGKTRKTSYTIVHELAPGDYGFRVVAFDVLNHIVADTDFCNCPAIMYRNFRVSY